MPRPLTPGNVRRISRHIEQTAMARAERGLTAAALGGERQAKVEAASGGSHPKGTPTPAVRGRTGPAVVTGNLRRNVTHTRPTRAGAVIRAKVGVAGGAPYGSRLEQLGYRFMTPTAAYLRREILPLVVVNLRRGSWKLHG